MKEMSILNIIKSTAYLYFTEYYRNNDSEVIDVSFEAKNAGVQDGHILEIKYKTKEEPRIVTKRYFIKVHSGVSSSAKNHLDYREMFVYNLLNVLSIGPKCHFFYNLFNVKEFFIATESLGPDFFTMPELVLNYRLIDSSKRIYLSDIYSNDYFHDLHHDENFTKNTKEFVENFLADDQYKQGLIYLDLVNKMLYLRDLTTNGENYGFLRKEIKIVDFSFLANFDEENFHLYERFLGRNIDASIIDKAYLIPIFDLINKNKPYKIEIAKKLIQSINFQESIQKAKLETDKYIEANYKKLFATPAEKETVDKELNVYITNMTTNFQAFKNSIQMN